MDAKLRAANQIRSHSSLSRDMYEEKGPDGKRAHTVEYIAKEFGVTRPTIYRHLTKP